MLISNERLDEGKHTRQWITGMNNRFSHGFHLQHVVKHDRKWHGVLTSAHAIEESLSNEKAGKQPHGERSDNLQPEYRSALQLAYTRARSKLRLASPL
jgi:hypothetical protein